MSTPSNVSNPPRAGPRPPFRYQHTLSYYPASSGQAPSSSSSSSSTPLSSTNEKEGGAVPMDDFNFDEKAGIALQQQHQHSGTRDSQQTRTARSHRTSRSGRGHARTTSRDDPHWQSNGSSEARGRPRPSLDSSSRSTQQALYYPHRYHSHPPPPPGFQIYPQRHTSSVPTDAGTSSTCCGQSVSPRLKAWIPLGAWIATSLAFLIAIGWYKEEVFLGLEKLSDWIRNEGYEGQAILFFLIFITTFPPMPLYSTLIVLSGYCLGAWYGAVISYFAALSGAVVVFVLSRTYLRSHLAEMIASAPVSIKRAIRAVEKQPKLLFLIRLSPYPYNLMNALLATSRISFSTYTWCTALSLFKVIVHTTIGASIHKFSDYHTHSHSGTNDGDTTESGNDEGDGDDWNKIFTIFGVVLCVVVLVYLSWVARRAVDDADDDFSDGSHLPYHRQSASRGRGRVARAADEDDGEAVAFLSPMAQDDSRRPSFDFARLTGGPEANVMMESPFRPTVPLTRTPSPYRGVHPS
ncbi:hypothetical protein FRB90_001264 [Tulasnella sp. 427]|nr:hypothetical protein FRB90_001264 [Tulasnella sp. 427]